MSIELRAYINFSGNAREAFEYYESVFGGELQVMTFRDAQALPETSSGLDKVMNAELRTTHFTLMGSDIIEETPFEVTVGNNFNLGLVGDGAATLDEIAPKLERLAADGTPVIPLGRVMWGAIFGSVIDKFGVNWMVNIDVPQGEAGDYERDVMAEMQDG